MWTYLRKGLCKVIVVSIHYLQSQLWMQNHMSVKPTGKRIVNKKDKIITQYVQTTFGYQNLTHIYSKCHSDISFPGNYAKSQTSQTNISTSQRKYKIKFCEYYTHSMLCKLCIVLFFFKRHAALITQIVVGCLIFLTFFNKKQNPVCLFFFLNLECAEQNSMQIANTNNIFFWEIS